MKAAALVVAVVLFAGACGQGPTLELGDDRRTTGGSDARDGAAPEEGGAGAPGPVDGGALDATGAMPPDSGGSAPSCRLDGECDRERPRCHEGTCVECLSADDCSDAEHPFCVDGECEECEGAGCEGQGECTANDDCEACADNADCTEAERPVCGGERCVECTTDEHCASSELGYCNVTEGECK